MPASQKAWYRPEIDGLRALAIIPVVLFHANIAGFAGGYIGVDIFFVISGFLITSIILRELKEERFSLVQFWERRMRRIVPALFVVVVATVAGGYAVILFPIDFIDLGQSTLAQAAFLANVFFMRNNGYFAGPSEYMPLLHTWSLSVEEQFYIIFPVLMLLLWKFAKRAIVPILIFLATASLVYSYYLLSLVPMDSFTFPGPNIWSETRNVTAAFYFLPSRAFELLIGTLIALGGYAITGKRTANVVAFGGLLLIIYAIVAFDRETPFPGVYALIPTLGTAAIIVANTKVRTAVGELLSFPLFIYIGLISYSLYLWHWPLLVLGRHYDGDFSLSTAETSVIIVLSFVMAYLTYRYVETPFRDKRWLPKQRQMLLGGVVALVVMAGAGGLIIMQKGFPDRLGGVAASIANANVDFGPRRDECFVNSFNTGNKPCLINTTDPAEVDFIVWGDSHAAALLPMIEEEAKRRGLAGATFITPACIPISNTITEPVSSKCQAVKDYARVFIATHNVQHIFLIARWSGYRRLTLENSPADADRQALAEQAFTAGLQNMLAELTESGLTVSLVKQVPQHSNYDARLLTYQAVHQPESLELSSVTATEHDATMAFPHGVFDEAAKQPKVSTIEPATLLCPQGDSCLLEKDDVILYENADHINQTGAALLTPLFAPIFDSLKN